MSSDFYMYAMTNALTCEHTHTCIHTNILIKRISWTWHDGSVGRHTQVGLDPGSIPRRENSLHIVVPDFRIHPYIDIIHMHAVINNFKIIFKMRLLSSIKC